MSLPPYAVTFRGKPACPCLATWLPVYEAELLRRGIIRHSIDIYQLIGNAPASAGVHSQGGAFDIAQTQREAVAVAREMGADATWARTTGSFATNQHTHGVLRGCPHNGPARYQINAVDAGYNGLGHLGHGGRDDGPRPLSRRTWREGIAWARNLQRTNRWDTLKGGRWNLRQGRNVKDAVDEVVELLTSEDLDFLLVCEAADYMPALGAPLRAAGYRRIWYRLDGSARDSAVIVRKRIPRRGRRLHRLNTRGWERKPGRKGLHWPRSAPSVRIAWLRVMPAHLAPGPFGPRFPLRKAANVEGFATLTRILRRWNKNRTPWLVGVDPNRPASDPVARAFLTATGATATGRGIDWSASRGVKVTGDHEVEFGTSDHNPWLFTVTKETR